MRASEAAWLALALLVARAAARRTDQDFEFDDDSEQRLSERAPAAAPSVPRRYVYDPHNPLCQSLQCARREVCVVRTRDGEGEGGARTALCANKKDILRRGDVIVAATWSTWDAELRDGERDNDDGDVFYDSGAARDPDDKPDRCVGCPVRGRGRSGGGGRGRGGRGEFLCGSDNRTYSSLCRLDLHNCVRRTAPPVTLACRGFCPCAPRARPRPQSRLRPAHHSRSRLRPAHQDHLHYDDDQRRKLESSENEVLPDKSFRRRPSKDLEGCEMDEMANRLLDWFSVLMDEAGEVAPPLDGFPRDCKPEVRWMFAHLDTDGDGVLSAANLYSLRHDERERCLRPFWSACGAGGGAGGAGGAGVSRGAWCGCLRGAARPCTALARAHPAPHPGAYVPACDARGYYRPRQCHAALGVCWCVDAHGVERPGSRTKGAPSCPGDKSSESGRREDAEAGGGSAGRGAAEGEGTVQIAGEGEGEGAPADDEDAGGSGDADLRF